MTKTIIVAFFAFALLAGAAGAATVAMKISGPGAVNDSTIKAGEKVSFDFYWSNDKDRRGFSTGFRLFSPTIKKVIHVADSGKGINTAGDIKGWNGWNDASTFDLRGIIAAQKKWDGNLPDTIGFAGLCVKKIYTPHPEKKVLSFDLIIPETGDIQIDSTFFPPGMSWKFSDGEKPAWKGPYKWKVVK